ncbi:MAG TPA: ribosome silencing factor [Steroidobacteraceae bacterium]|nr:ribosome silencing factor [Steroidobacteraceae bacterium]
MAAKRAKKSSRATTRPATKAKSAGKPKALAPKSKRAAAATAPKKSARKPQARTAATAKVAGVNAIVKVVEGALEDMKAVNVKVMDVHQLTDIADTMVIASGNSDRHVRSIADRVVEFAKKAGFRPMGVEGERDGEWVLVDLQDVIVHIMLPRVREFYRLENLWDVSAARREAAVASGE